MDHRPATGPIMGRWRACGARVETVTSPSPTDALLETSSYPPIAEYALPVGLRGHRARRAERQRRVDVPAAHGRAEVFGAILDRDAGGFRFGPADARVPAARRYLPGTMILETSWGTPTGWVIVRDCLLIGPWHHENSRSNSHRRAPTDYDCEHVLLREVRCVNGEVQMSLDCSPMFELRPGTGDLDVQRRRATTTRSPSPASMRPASG